ncbi:MAG: glycoside hydrolase, partial [Lacipirellulaceae bacterium]
MTTTENGLEVATTGQGQDSLIDFDFSKTPMAGPVALEFSMQTNVRGDLGEYIVYWVNEQEVSWRKFRRVLFRPDGKSHTYRLPLAASGRVRAVRFSLGKQKHRVSLSAMKLAPITSSPPEPKSELLNQITINNESLFLDLDAKEHVYKITDKVTNRTWRSEPVSKWLVLKRVEQTDPNILQVTMFDRFAKQPLTAHIELASDSTVKFSLDAATSQSPIAAANYPPRFSTDMSAGKFVFCDRSCGVLLDQKDPTYADWPLRVYGNTHCLDMPWVGLFDEQLRDGMMVVVDTPTDAEVAFVQHEDGRHWPEVRWLPALDSFGYRRSVSLKFTSGGGYVEFARKYREDLKRQGRFRTLADKAKYKPKVSLLRGAPAIWGGDDAESFIRALSPLGIDRGIVSKCKDAKTVAWLNNLGYLTGRYDSYTDILEGETNFQRDNIKQTSVISRPGGKPKLGWKLRRGKQMYWRSSACWKAAEQAYTPAQLEEVPYNARFVDVAAAADLLEDFH